LPPSGAKGRKRWKDLQQKGLGHFTKKKEKRRLGVDQTARKRQNQHLWVVKKQNIENTGKTQRGTLFLRSKTDTSMPGRKGRRGNETGTQERRGRVWLSRGSTARLKHNLFAWHEGRKGGCVKGQTKAPPLKERKKRENGGLSPRVNR